MTLSLMCASDSRRSDFVATISAIRDAIVMALKEAGIGLPNPDVRILLPRQSQAWQTALHNQGVQKTEE